MTRDDPDCYPDANENEENDDAMSNVSIDISEED